MVLADLVYDFNFSTMNLPGEKIHTDYIADRKSCNWFIHECVRWIEGSYHFNHKG